MSTCQVALQFSSRRNARQGGHGLPVLILQTLTLTPSKKVEDMSDLSHRVEDVLELQCCWLGCSPSQPMIGRDPKHTNCASPQTTRLIYSKLKINLHYHLQYSRSIFFNSWNRQVPTVLLSHKQTSNNSNRCPFLRRGINRDVSLHLSRPELCHASGCSHVTLRIFTETTSHT